MSNTTKPNYYSDEVKKFQRAFGHGASDTPVVIDFNTSVKRAIWSVEELVEFLHASSSNHEQFLAAVEEFKDGLDNAVIKSLTQECPTDELDRIVAQSDALVDELYFNQGSFAVSGVNPQPIFDIVQAANMAKLGADGKPILREHDHKIMKPENWARDHAPEPKIIKEIKTQLENK